jgi:formylmethanofuran dehydrogenase subunit E
MSLTESTTRKIELAKQRKAETTNDEATLNIERLAERLDMLDRRLDNVDSIVTVVAERVMKQPITLSITCSKCGQKIEIALIGSEKPSR